MIKFMKSYYFAIVDGQGMENHVEFFDSLEKTIEYADMMEYHEYDVTVEIEVNIK